MKTELERHKTALEHVFWALSKIGSREFIMRTRSEVNAILNPPPEVETFVVERFVLCYPDGSVDPRVLTREDIQGLDCKGGTLRNCAWELTRPKEAMVERSITAVGIKMDSGDNGLSIWPHGAKPEGDAESWGDIYGKTGTVTFTWHEPKGEQQ